MKNVLGIPKALSSQGPFHCRAAVVVGGDALFTKRPHPLDRELIIRMGLVSGKCCLVVKFAVDHEVDLGAQLIGLHIGADFQEPRMASTLNWTFTEGKRDLTVPIRSRLAVNTAEAAVDAAVAGLGITRVLSYQAARAETAGLLAPLLADFEPPPAPVHLVYPAQGLVPLKLRALIDFATPRLRATLNRSQASLPSSAL